MTSKVHLALFLLFACTVTVSLGGGGGGGYCHIWAI